MGDIITGNEPIGLGEVKETNRYGDTTHTYNYRGLTIRQHFASLFMNGLLSSWGQHDVTDYSELASDSVKASDALIAELNKI